MGDGGLLSLSWNNHKTTFCHILSSLREKERYTDVTLACEGKFYPVHKLVLSTCSEYFESMFEQTPCKHPIIVLKDLKSDEVESLLNYMYAGVVNVAQNDLARLIKAAELLKVKGLAVPDEPPPEADSKKNFSPARGSREDPTSPPPKRRRREESGGAPGDREHREQHVTVSSPTASPRTSPYHTASSEYHQDNSRTPNEAHASEHGSEKSIDRLEPDVRSEPTSDTKHNQHTPARVSSPMQVMLDETLVKEEIMDPEDQDSLMNCGMDYGSLASDGRIENATTDGATQDHQGQMLPTKYEPQPLGPSQSHHLAESVVEALAGPSGMQGWLGGGGDMGGAFAGVDGYGGDSRHQELRQGLQGQQPQAHQMLMVGTGEGQQQSGPSFASIVWDDASHDGTEQSTKEHQCPFCPYKTTLKGNFKRHGMKHTGEKPFQCPYCNYRCSLKGNLVKHIRVHTRKKPFQCPHCNYRCSLKTNLVKHIRVHTGEKPFQCAHCNYRCSQKAHLVKHNRVHTGKKPFQCPHCNYRCSLKASLVRHNRVHTGEKPFQCSQCSYQASHREDLKDHMRSKHATKNLH